MVDLNPAHLFVYGTLRRGAGHPMFRLLAQHSEYAGPARYRGRLYDVGEYPAAVPDAIGPASLCGELYRLLRPETLLPLLDRYEGCTDRQDSRAEYRRVTQPVLRESGDPVTAWIYLYNRPVDRLRPIPSGDYLKP